MLLAHNISMSLATVIRVRECSLNQFCPSLFASLFVHWEPQQILTRLNTKYRANLVKARVNVQVTLLHIYWVCQYKLFFISEGWEGFTEPSNSRVCITVENSPNPLSVYISLCKHRKKVFCCFYKITLPRKNSKTLCYGTD